MRSEAPSRPDDRQLRQFAWSLVAFVTIAVTLRWWRGRPLGVESIVFAAIGWVFGALGAIAPRRIEWLFIVATTVTRPIGKVVSECVLAVMYFGVVTPMAVASRLVGRDRLRRTFDRGASTYWVPRKTTIDPRRYFRQS